MARSPVFLERGAAFRVQQPDQWLEEDTECSDGIHRMHTDAGAGPQVHSLTPWPTAQRSSWTLLLSVGCVSNWSERKL